MKWEGASEANPPHGAKAMEKAVRWAILSAEKSMSPTLTAFTLPKTGANAYQKRLTHPMVRELGCIEREHMSFKTTDHWNRAAIQAPLTGKRRRICDSKSSRPGQVPAHATAT